MKLLLPFSVIPCHQTTESNDHAVIKAIDNKLPRRSMPDAHYQKYDQIRQTDRKSSPHASPESFFCHLSKASHPAGQRNGIKNIILHPGTQRNMPAMPEICDRPGKIRPLEILIQRNPKQLADSDHHIDSSGKISVQLYRISQRCKHCQTGIRLVFVKQRIYKNGSRVRHHHFLKKSPQNPLKSFFHPFPLPTVRSIQLLTQP